MPLFFRSCFSSHEKLINSKSEFLLISAGLFLCNHFQPWFIELLKVSTVFLHNSNHFVVVSLEIAYIYFSIFEFWFFSWGNQDDCNEIKSSKFRFKFFNFDFNLAGCSCFDFWLDWTQRSFKPVWISRAFRFLDAGRPGQAYALELNALQQKQQQKCSRWESVGQVISSDTLRALLTKSAWPSTVVRNLRSPRAPIAHSLS